MFEHPTGKVPKKVVIVGCGPTRSDYLDVLGSDDPHAMDADEVWAVNTASNFCPADMSFIMDDYGAIRGHLPVLQKVFEDSKIPIITSVPRKNSPASIAYPLGDVLTMNPLRPYLNHTVAYMLAYAALIGVKELIIFGADYISSSQDYKHTAPHADKPPRYMACAGYWIGFCEARGMVVVVTPNSPLLDSDYHWSDNFYGYIIKPLIRREGDQTEPAPSDKE